MVDVTAIETNASEVCSVCTSTSSSFVAFSQCGHRFCQSCVQTYFEYSVRSGNSSLTCLQCNIAVTELEIKLNLEPAMYQRYLSLGLRHYLALQSNVRNCIAPDCPFVYLLDDPSDCTDDHFVCQHTECGLHFCYQCKEPWHEGKTCSKMVETEGTHKILTKQEMESLNIKTCPRCNTPVEKVDDGACNHIQCSVCHLEFCWLCLRPSSEIHYLSPTGCPMYGQRRWSCGKRWLIRICLWIWALPLVFLLAFCLFFICLVAVPCLIGYLVYKFALQNSKIHMCVQVGILIATISMATIASPFISFLLALIVIPLGFLYLYVFIPIHLLRTYYGNNEMSSYDVRHVPIV